MCRSICMPFLRRQGPYSTLLVLYTGGDLRSDSRARMASQSPGCISHSSVRSGPHRVLVRVVPPLLPKVVGFKWSSTIAPYWNNTTNKAATDYSFLVHTTRTMPYKHIVSFKYKDTTSESTRSDVYARFNGLKQKCVLQDGSSYIVDLESGKANISPEGMGKGLDVSERTDCRSISPCSDTTGRTVFCTTAPVHRDI